MAGREINPNPEGPQIPDEIINNIRVKLSGELDKTLDAVQLRAIEARTTFETQWAEGAKTAKYSLEWGDPLNANLPLFASTLMQWMDQDYGEGMISIGIRSRGREGDCTDELVAENKQLGRQARFSAGAVDISESALRTALGHVREGKEHAIDHQDYESAARWRDYEKNVMSALGGLGLAQPED